jgi:glycerol-3-phosphate dehydrogenase (NAD(P)+)
LTEENIRPVQVAVVGGGSWATAIVKILSENNLKIRWWIRHKEDADYIETFHHNPKYLSDVQINIRKVKVCNKINKAVNKASIIILAVPAAFVKGVLDLIPVELLKDKIIVSAIKGMVPEENLLVTDLLEQKFGVDPANLCVIAGPCHAEEVAMEKQSYLTIAGKDIKKAQYFAEMLSCRYVKTSTSDDIYGVEYAAVMKNIIALACGITHGLNYGDNFFAVLVSNALQEVKRFLDKVYPMHRDLNASAYVGDLLVTAYSQFSRNRTFGSMIGRGYSVKSAQVEMNMVAEGYYAVKSIHEVNKKYNVEMPICEAVYNILYEKIAPSVEVQLLRDRIS